MPANKKKPTKLMEDDGDGGLNRFKPPTIKGKCNKMSKDTSLMKDNYSGGLKAYEPPVR